MRRRAVPITLAILMVMATPVLAAPGDAVSGYGVDGTHAIPHDGGPHWVGDIVARPGGEVLVTGSSVGAGSGEQSFWVSEVAADGISRTGATDIGLGAPHEFGAAIALQPDGSFFVAGDRGALGGTDTDMFLASFDAGGDLDPTFGLPSPGIPDGVDVLVEPGTEHATSVFVDGSSVMVAGWRDTTNHPGIVWRLNAATGAPDQTFGTFGRVDIDWTDAAQADEVETTLLPTGSSNYLAVGFFNGGKASWLSSKTISNTGTVGADQEFHAAAITGYDAIPLTDGSVAVAATGFGTFSDNLVITKLAPDGSLQWQSAFVAINAFTTDVSVEELRDGTMAVAVSTSDFTSIFDTQVLHFDTSGNLTGTLVTDAAYETLAGSSAVVASSVSTIDGSLFIATTTNPQADADSFAITRFEGDASGRFVDDDGNTHEANIERLAAAGITGGCDPTNLALYCPDDDVSRAQMATFLADAAGIPPAGPGFDPFTDDNGNTHEANINAIAAAAITLGCDVADPTRYCPADSVTRGQMATFLVRAFDLDTIVTPANPDPFADDDGSVHEANIAILFDAGITVGCDSADSTRFCPAEPVSRAQMASFIMRTLDFVGP